MNITIKKILKEFRFLKNSGYTLEKYTKNSDIEVMYTNSIHNIFIVYYLSENNEMKLRIAIDNVNIYKSPLFSLESINNLKKDIENVTDDIKLKFLALFIANNLINKMEGKVIFSNKPIAKFLLYFASICLFLPTGYIFISSLKDGSIESDPIGTFGSMGAFMILFIILMVFFILPIYRYQLVFDFDNQKISKFVVESKLNIQI